MAPTIGMDWAQILGNLEPDWDGYGGKSITLQAMTTIRSFHTIPCSSGGIQLEIHQDGFDIEIEVNPDGRITSALICCEPK